VGFVDALDRTQRRRSFLGIPIGVFFKFVDDQGPYLAAIISFYATIAIFPLLVLATSILGFVLQGNPELQEQLLESALATFPIIGDELGRPDRLQGSTGAVVIGVLAAIYGSLGLGQALQNALNVAWSVPRNNRPNPVRLRLKSLLLLVTAGGFVVAITTVSLVISQSDLLGAAANSTVQWLIRIANVLLVGLLLTIVFRLAAARRHHLGRAAPGAFTVAVLWLLLQEVGAIYTTKVLAGTDGMDAAFGLVLGLIGIIYIAAFTGVIGIEVNVVLARKLWPRSLRTLFVDRPELTDADRRAYASYAQAQRHKTSSEVQVGFKDPDSGELLIPQEPRRNGQKSE
jgi:membrane protein